MLKKLFLGLCVVGVLATSCNQVPGAGEVKMNNETDSVSYALGYIIAANMRQQLSGPFDTVDFKTMAKAYANSQLSDQMKEGYEQSFETINYEVFRSAFVNQLGYDKSYFTEEQANMFLQTAYQKVQDKKALEGNDEAKANKEKADAFLAENAKKEGVVSLPSGLQYEVMVPATGAKPTTADQVEVHYHGTLLDGTVFDSSVDRGQTATFGVTQVIKGWTEALQLMPEGSKYKLFIPAELAYGSRGSGQIGPMEMLIFEVELVSIVK
ncbi:FKBP-type peptidyl-prolyl cis-trans isomerase [Saccharicrinis aurantiacus]|uniref:FKBP-type peptidyl-prolyl cis-trans isomerase n=1 Tax=Saccharicrinis aurantiacus TaxID=1849719 RepID=UPI00094FB05D|nr:FKBP-type peptidyl-prolyl cis-trans isomerase [Saccharicrinis aurantiacus]